MEHDIKIINCDVNDDNQLTEALRTGYSIKHALAYTENFYQDKMKYAPNGNTYYEKEFNYSQTMVKYILERDGIARNVYG